MPFCPNCGTEVNEDTRFCSECGRRLAVGQDTKGMSKKKLAGIIVGCAMAIIVIAVIATATFTYTLSVNVNPPQGGSVSPSGGEYEAGMQVTLTANPASGYTFAYWSGAASGTTSIITIAMNSHKSLTANFRGTTQTYTLTTNINPSGGGSVSPSGGEYEAGMQVTLTANPASGYTFAYWSGDASGTTSIITIAMNSHKSLTANFEPSPSTSPPSAEVTLKDNNYVVHYEWNYEGNRWEWNCEIPKETYEYFSDRHRTSDYSEYVSNPSDDEWMKSIADVFSDEAKDSGWDEFKTVGFVLSFVQSMPYTSDELTAGYDEYPRYPVETLVDKGGDCEDTSILFASIVRGMGYGVVLLHLEEDGHMAVGVKISSDTVTNWHRRYPLTYYTTESGEIYAYCETTGEGWELGYMPEDFTSTSAKIIELT